MKKILDRAYYMTTEGDDYWRTLSDDEKIFLAIYWQNDAPKYGLDAPLFGRACIHHPETFIPFLRGYDIERFYYDSGWSGSMGMIVGLLTDGWTIEGAFKAIEEGSVLSWSKPSETVGLVFVHKD